MPLFMIISGYLFFFSFKKRELGDLLKHKLQALIQPIIVYSFLDFMIQKGIKILLGASDIKEILLGNWITNITSLWFLWSVLSSMLAVSLAYKLSSKTYIRVILVCLLAMGIVLMPNAVLSLWMFPYFYLGFVFSKIKFEHKSNKMFCGLLKLRFLSLILFPLMVVFYEKKHYIYITGLYSREYGLKAMTVIDIYRWVIGLVGSVFVMVVFEQIMRFSNKIKFGQLQKIGNKSLQIYCISVTVLSFGLPIIYEKAVKMIGSNILAQNMVLYSLVFTPAIAIIYVYLILLIITGLNKLKIDKIIFGR